MSRYVYSSPGRSSVESVLGYDVAAEEFDEVAIFPVMVLTSDASLVCMGRPISVAELVRRPLAPE